MIAVTKVKVVTIAIIGITVYVPHGRDRLDLPLHLLLEYLFDQQMKKIILQDECCLRKHDREMALYLKSSYTSSEPNQINPSQTIQATEQAILK